MIPYGYPKNFDLYDKAKEGDILHCKDEKIFKIKSKMAIFVNSPVAECISQMIYGQPMRETFKKFKDKHKGDIQDEKVLVIVYEPQDLRK